MAARQTSRAPCPPLPADAILRNSNTGDSYKLGRFLGKGGFAQCWEVRNLSDNRVSACKVVQKTMLTKPHQKEKMLQEIRIHRKLSHKFVVKFLSHFEDNNNVYVLLELCKRRSLMEVLKRRSRLTYPETRYFMFQLLDGVSYLHNLNIIHRDLKLGNLFLTGDIQLRIGDFGLATEVNDENDKRRTLCGTPNYIAPEILAKVGHSYEVDIWSCGCILYTLLVGKPPFETPNLKRTYEKIQRCEYCIDPERVPASAQKMIEDMLQKNPSRRPTSVAALKYAMFTESPIPAALPESILTTEPRLQSAADRRPLRDFQFANNVPPVPNTNNEGRVEDKELALGHINSLEKQLQELLQSGYEKTDLLPIELDNAADPAAMPVYWVSKWVDYTDKYGLGYQLCDNSLAVLFNDHSRMVLLCDTQVHFIDHQGHESYHTITAYPPALEKKVTLIKYFRQYMSQHLVTAGADAPAPACADVARVPYLRVWFRTQSAIVLFLSNGTLQLNFFRDHTKIILCPLMGAVSYIDKQKNFRTYSLRTMHAACPAELSTRLTYAQTICPKVREHLTRLN